ncbi:MAG: 3-oxoacyl-ACP reductase [Actinomycetota bacterium]|nr:3-oxoacyl-ACP reductase [Actinomycetota bacterium]
MRLDGLTAVVTGAGQGLGRAEALALAAAGANVVVNDLGEAADTVVAEIASAGGSAVSFRGDVSQWAMAEALVASAVSTFGSLEVLVNNAGILRDRMIFNISEQEWDAVIGVHLKGHAATTRFATAYWRDQSKTAGGEVYGRVVNTSSEAFLFGSGGQPNYAAAKAGITALTVATAKSCARYGVRANAICPRARTQMTAHVFGDAPDGQVDPLGVEHVAPLVAYLAAPAAAAISGQVFVAYGPMVVLASAPAVEKRFDASGPLWTAADLHGALGSYFSGRDPDLSFSADSFMSL